MYIFKGYISNLISIKVLQEKFSFKESLTTTFKLRSGARELVIVNLSTLGVRGRCIGSGKGLTYFYSKSTIKKPNEKRYYCFAKSTDTFFKVKFTDLNLIIIDNNR